ncbi:J domain-containing protein [Geobacter sp. FeAm09]|uniref:J domain-containing protein n=1 Tax=Geobacter sp. FeAm09 TaxID=2597769 RepID=UPI0011EED237|nr:J domain-containing protein [Geobacter sp. FeAm09]QEM67600.1 J domain-containing protein [Geobacter sp. FeAm09]
MTYADLKTALHLFGLGQRASLREIKARHRALVKRHHPDTGQESDPEAIRQVNAAYRVLLEYVAEYRFSFSEAEFYEQNPEERLWRQFKTDPLWGDG